MKKISPQVEAGHQVAPPWRQTAVGSLVADVSAVKAAGGSRKVTLPNSTLRIADLDWSEVKDVDGRVMCWQRTIAGVPVLILNNSPQEETMSKKTKDTEPQAPEKNAEPKA